VRSVLLPKDYVRLRLCGEHATDASDASGTLLLDVRRRRWSVAVLEALELPRDAFTAVFAIGRVAGWTAHILEQERGGRIIRPQSRYVGPTPLRAA
jgi:sugar (pentulose or hexulose) kinase